MIPSAKDKLVQDVIRFQDLIKDHRYSPEMAVCFHGIISSLLANDGYDTIFTPQTDDTKFDFLCTKKSPSERIGVSLKRKSGKTDISHVLERISMAYNYPFNRILIVSTGGFTNDCYKIINNVEPVNVELFDLDAIKNWVSRIETESDLQLLDYEDIIKVVSRTFIERIAADPDFLRKIEWREFEKTIAELFEGLGFKVMLTPSSKDGGKDVVLEIVKKSAPTTYIVEIKHWRSMQKVGQNSVKEFIKVICNEKREKGLFLSTYGFTDNAFEGLTELERTKIKFGSEQKIMSLCKTYLKVKSGIWTPLQDLQEVLFEQTL